MTPSVLAVERVYRVTNSLVFAGSKVWADFCKRPEARCAFTPASGRLACGLTTIHCEGGFDDEHIRIR